MRCARRRKNVASFRTSVRGMSQIPPNGAVPERAILAYRPTMRGPPAPFGLRRDILRVACRAQAHASSRTRVSEGWWT
jgi:hypothetical protein